MEFYLGQIFQGGWNFAPSGSALCQGQILSISQNSALFALLGTQFGGNGTTTFGLPDLRGRSMIGQGQGPGLSNYIVGQQGGTENVSILTSNLPAHTHAVTGALSASGVHATAQGPSAGAILGHSVDLSGTSSPGIYCPAGTTAGVALGGLNIAAANTGNNIPLGILDPYLCVTQAIALVGVFPSRN